MEDKQKNKIANELFFIGKIYVISFVIILVLAIILSDKPQRVGGDIFLAPLVFVGIGYAIRLIRWVFKWKS